MRVAVTGASGLVGAALLELLGRSGHEAVPVVRGGRSTAAGIRWDPAAGTTDLAAWSGVDAVVNLAGENIASGRWTAGRKRRILESRISCTRLAAETAAALSPPPAVLVNASAIGFYGHRGDEEVDEDDSAGTGFLADVCTGWEAAVRPAQEAGLRTVLLRIGIVLSRRGGALARMLTPFRLGLGGRLGNGRQYMSWVSLEDLAGVALEAIRNDTLTGPVNAVAPGAVTNAEFSRILGRVLRRPAVLPVPAALLRLLAGEMAEALLLQGARVRPGRLMDAGYRFLHPGLEAALRSEVG